MSRTDTNGRHLLILFIRAAALVILAANLYYRSVRGWVGPGV
ncbi:MAG: hypothetical protein OEY97_05400 [Nitrospirota bacterium]|nr:hypothetical protein [Nitrospirota bacterium]